MKNSREEIMRGGGGSCYNGRMPHSYYIPQGGLPAQDAVVGEAAIATPAYIHIPAACLTDIVASKLPHWEATRLWVLARPLSGFAETFSHYVMEVGEGGGSLNPDDDKGAEHVLFVTDGAGKLLAEKKEHELKAGSYVYLPPETVWVLRNTGEGNFCFHWFRKRYEKVGGVDVPDNLITSDDAVVATPMPDCDGLWATKRFIDPDDLRYDMAVNIVEFGAGGAIPFPETHVMEHGIYVLQGRARYLVNRDWIDVGPGDYLWLRAFCPQRCIAGDDGAFRYLLYKDVNRHARLNVFNSQ